LEPISRDLSHTHFNNRLKSILLLLFVCNQISAKSIPGYFINNAGESLNVDFKIPIVDKYYIDFIKIQQNIKCETANGEKLKLTPEDAKKVVFDFRDQTIVLVSMANTLKLKAINSVKESIFLVQLSDSPIINSYLFFKGTGTSNLAAHGESFSSKKAPRRNVLKITEPVAKINFEGNTKYIFQKANGELFMPTKQTFDTDLAEFMKDCPEVSQFLKDVNLKKYQVSEIVARYVGCVE